MQKQYPNNLKSERSVEIPYVVEKISEFKSTDRVLEVGGIPSHDSFYHPIYQKINEIGFVREICDFRGGEWSGDFNLIDFGENKYDNILTVSVTEHFVRCYEEPGQPYRKDYDKQMIQKCLTLLKKGGKIIMTVPFGEEYLWPYHQSYNYDHILHLTEGAKIDEMLIYALKGEEWVLTNYKETESIRNEGPVYCVGLFTITHAN